MPPETSGEELAGELNLKSKMNENEQKLIRADLEAYIAKDSGSCNTSIALTNT